MPFITQGKNNWKFLLIVAVLAVIIGGGTLCWIWHNQGEEVSLTKHCQEDSDCGWGTIQGDPMRIGCVLDGVTDEGPPNLKCVCNKNYIPSKCEQQEIILEQVTITTDKTEYEQEEKIGTVLVNNLDKTISYRDWSNAWNECGGSSFKLGKKENGEYNFFQIGLTECLKLSVELQAGSTMIYSLDPKKLEGIPSNRLDKGTYKWEFSYVIENDNKEKITEGGIIYSNEFTIKEGNEIADCKLQNIRESDKFEGSVLLDAMKKSLTDKITLYLYFNHELNNNEINQIEKLGIIIQKESWIPPVGMHPLGFYIAESKVSDICKLINVDLVKRVASGEGYLEPQE